MCKNVPAFGGYCVSKGQSMNLIRNADGTYTCEECKFVFGQGTISEKGATFNEYHTNLHKLILVKKESK